MKLHTVVPFALLVALSLCGSAQAQGVPSGIARGAAVGNQAAGPVGGVVGGAIGGVVGGVTGAVQGVLGVNPQPAYAPYPEEPRPEYRPRRTRVSARHRRSRPSYYR